MTWNDIWTCFTINRSNRHNQLCSVKQHLSGCEKRASGGQDPSGSARLSILLSSFWSQNYKLDYIRLQQLHGVSLETAVSLFSQSFWCCHFWLTSFHADRSALRLMACVFISTWNTAQTLRSFLFTSHHWWSLWLLNAEHFIYHRNSPLRCTSPHHW